MPVVVMHGGGGAGYVAGGKNARPNSHLCLSIVATLFNPIFGQRQYIFVLFLIIMTVNSLFILKRL